MTAALENIASLVQKNARKDGFKFLNISDVQWKPFAEKFSKNELHVSDLPSAFADDPFAQLALLSGQVKEIIVSKGSQKHVLENSSLGSDLNTYLFKIKVEENAELEFVYHQVNNADLNQKVAPAFSRLYFELGKNAQVRLTVIQKGIQKGQVRVHAECVGENSEMRIHGLTISEQNFRQDLWADVVHAVPHTRSDLIAWCVVQDEAHSVFNGTMTITQGAPFTEAFQKNKNLILSERGSVDTFPKLFISNNEVKCAHGSSVSSLEPDQMNYLQSRGIDRDQAEQMLLKGFIRQAIDWIKDKETRQKMEVSLFGRINHDDLEDYGGQDL